MSIQTALFSAEYYSFGRTVNLSFGNDWQKLLLKTEIFVPVSGNILDLNIALDIQHTSICDLQFFIQNPSGLRNYIHGYDIADFKVGRQNYRWTIFDAESPLSLENSAAPFTGAFCPSNPDGLTAFYGTESCGLWIVEVYDGVYLDTGIFRCIRLDFITESHYPATEAINLLIPEPMSILLFAIIGTALNWRK